MTKVNICISNISNGYFTSLDFGFEFFIDVAALDILYYIRQNFENGFKNNLKYYMQSCSLIIWIPIFLLKEDWLGLYRIDKNSFRNSFIEYICTGLKNENMANR